jgi:hypothetical protein
MLPMARAAKAFLITKVKKVCRLGSYVPKWNSTNYAINLHRGIGKSRILADEKTWRLKANCLTQESVWSTANNTFLSNGSSRSAIHTQHSDKARDFFEVPQCQAHGRIVAAAHVNKKAVFPGPPSHRTRLDLAQIEIAQGKNTQSLE